MRRVTPWLLPEGRPASNAAPEETSDNCEDPRCNRSSNRVWYCVDCSSRICEGCWSQSMPHTIGKLGRDGLPHEKTSYRVYKRLENVLNPPASLEDLEKLHSDDIDSTWFGITKDYDGQPVFTDYDIYATLIGHAPSREVSKFPQLVSFIGQTNAGKSTLIKMLIDLQEPNETPNTKPSFPSPVVGSVLHDRLPTSADVHLYADPKTYPDLTPLLYADCEGLDAGEELPFGAAGRRTASIDAKRSASRLTPGRTRKLEWANTEERRTRQFAVTELYPRVLYTFSDVVVFVLRNAKTFQSTALHKLLEWGSVSLEKSINQPTLPHAIIAVNATEIGVNAEEWNVPYATESLLDSIKDSLDRINGVPAFIKLADKWREKGRTIRSVRDLIRCYYSSFRVVRIPMKGRYTLLDRQIRKLHEKIAECCDASFDAKRKARMLSSSDELSIYLQSAFDHFSWTLDRPFNFVEVSLKNNPIPDDFGGHILQLAISIQAHGRRRRSSWIFSNLSHVVGSSILLDCVRHRKGLPEDLFGEYEGFLQYALEEFCVMYSPCQFFNSKGSCVNVFSTHDPKGHQNDKGRIIAAGQYESDFNAEQYCSTWMQDIKREIRFVHEQLQEHQERGPREVSEERHLLKIHSRLMSELYDELGSAGKFLSHSTCFCCLMQAPQHSLPCGHVLCTACVRSYGKRDNGKRENKFVLKMESCPMHSEETRWGRPCVIRFKPDHAGVRLLSLDGGGIRGIVELEILRSIQEEFKNQIPIRAFFDLIVGTSTGGIISLSFGVKNWDIDDCISCFKEMCGQAFSPRELYDFPGLKHLATIKHASKYKTTPLRSALQKTLGEDYLFGGRHEDSMNYGAKVAVTATDEAGKRAIILANYSRTDTSKSKRRKATHDFPRPDNPELELRVWEAAAATSAAPSYFKPFVHKPTNRTYLDGALYNNNPVRVVQRERRLLWPDVATKHPDIFLSIGTSQNEEEIRKDLRTTPCRSKHSESVLNSRRGYKNRADESANLTWGRFGWSAFPNVRQMVRVMHNRFDNVLNAEIAWREFCFDAIDNDHAESDGLRYIRINPNIGYDPPSLDAKNQLKKLHEDTKRALNKTENRILIQRVAHTLVASSFYYEKTSAPKNECEDVHSCSGQICCRFEDGSKYVRALGDFLLHQQTHDFQPFFEIEEDSPQAEKRKIEITPEIITRMKGHADFELITPDVRVLKKSAKVTISLHLRGPHLPRNKTPISGFPRDLMTEDLLKVASQSSTGKLGHGERVITKGKDRRFRSSIDGLGLSNRRNYSSIEPLRSISEPISQPQHLLNGEADAWMRDCPTTNRQSSRVAELPAEELVPRRTRPENSRHETFPQEDIRRPQRRSQAEWWRREILPAEAPGSEGVSRGFPSERLSERVPAERSSRPKSPTVSPRRKKGEKDRAPLPSPLQAPQPRVSRSLRGGVSHESSRHQKSSRRETSAPETLDCTRSSRGNTERQVRYSRRDSPPEHPPLAELPAREPPAREPSARELPARESHSREPLSQILVPAQPREWSWQYRALPLLPSLDVPPFENLPSRPSNRPGMRPEPVSTESLMPPSQNWGHSSIPSFHEDTSVDFALSVVSGETFQFSRGSENTNDSYRRYVEERDRPPSAQWASLTQPNS